MSDAEIILILRSIDASLKALVARTDAPPQAPQKEAAPDADLDGKFGDPIVKAKDPREWSGETQVGKRFSECPSAYLDMVAARLEYFNSKLGDTEDDRKKRLYNTRDAARARGWAARIRAGYKPPAAQPAMHPDAVEY